MTGTKTNIRRQILGSSPYKQEGVLNEELLSAAKTISEAALVVVGTAGIITLAAVAPNIFKSIRSVQRISRRMGGRSAKQKNDAVIQSFYYLRRSGKIEFRKQKGEVFVSLTKLGKECLRKISGTQAPLPQKPDKWDGKWWLVAADIPTKQHRHDADRLRRKLKELGFYSLQRTLWLFPFNPKRTVEHLGKEYNVSPYVTLMEINCLESEDEAVARQFFKAAHILK